MRISFALVFFCIVLGSLLVDLLLLILENTLFVNGFFACGYMRSYVCLGWIISRIMPPSWFVSCLCHFFDLLHPMIYYWSPSKKPFLKLLCHCIGDNQNEISLVHAILCRSFCIKYCCCLSDRTATGILNHLPKLINHQVVCILSLSLFPMVFTPLSPIMHLSYIGGGFRPQSVLRHFAV